MQHSVQETRATFSGRWIGRRVPTQLRPRNPDRDPRDFLFSWDWAKENFYPSNQRTCKMGNEIMGTYGLWKCVQNAGNLISLPIVSRLKNSHIRLRVYFTITLYIASDWLPYKFAHWVHGLIWFIWVLDHPCTYLHPCSHRFVTNLSYFHIFKLFFLPQWSTHDSEHISCQCMTDSINHQISSTCT